MVLGPQHAALGALVGAGGLAAPAATQAQATPIRHVVVIFLENQSFDSLLGYWCDGRPGRCPDGGMPSSVRLSSGAVVTPGTSPDTVPNVNHSVAAQTAAIDGGKMDGRPNIPGGGQLVGAVQHGPDWSSTAVFITWDDCGCFYDQVPPGTNPDGTAQGPRVPLIIVSPYAKPGYTDTTATTFAGILAYTEHILGLSPLGANDAGAYPFTNAFDYTQAPRGAAHLVHRPLPASAKRIHLTPALENDPT